VLIDIAPALATFAGTLGLVFTTMENAGVFAVLGNAVEELAGPLATMISALLNGLAPILPPIFTAIGQIAGLLVGGLAGAIIELLPPLTTLATNVLVAIAQLLPLILPWLVTLTGLFTSALVGVVKGVADGLSGIIKALPPQVLGGIAVTLAAIVLSVKALNLGKSAFAGLQSLYSGLKGLLGLGGGGAIATAGDEAAGAMKLAMQQGGAAAAAAIRDAMGLGGKTAGAEIAAGEETGGAAAGAEEGLGTGAGAAAGKGGAAAEDAGAGLGAGAVLSSLILPAALAAGIIYALSKTKAAGGGSILAPAKGDLGVGGVWWNYIGKLLGPAGPLGAPKAGKAAAVAGGPSSYEAGGRGPGVPGASLAPVLPRLAPGDLAMLKSYAAMYGETLPAAYKTFADASVNVNSKFNGTGVAALDAQTRVGAVQAAFALLNAKGLSTAAIDNYTESFKLNGAGAKLTIADHTALVLQLMKTGLTYQQATADVDGMTTGLDGSQSAMATGAGARAQLISDIKAMHADTPKVNTDISNLAASVQQTGTNSAQTAGDRAQLIKDLEQSGVNAQTATAMVDGPNGYIAALKSIPASEGTILTVKGLGKWAVSQTMTAQTDPYGSLQAKNAAGAFIRAGTGPTADDVLVRVSKGELIVPANMVAAGMVDNLKGMIPGFAGGGKVVSSGVPGAAATEASDVQSTNSQIIATVKAQMMAYIKGQQAKAAAAAQSGNPPGGLTGAVGDLPGNWRAIVTYLTGHGFTAVEAAGVAGNIFAESGGSPSIWEAGGGGGYGLIQWTPPPPGLVGSGLLGELAQIVREGTGMFSDPITPAAAAYQYLMGRERPANPGATAGIREASANAVYHAMGYAQGESAPSGYAKGGLITEPIIGFGQNTGKTYTFGEKGPEWVTPAGSPGPATGSGMLANNLSIMMPEGSSIAAAFAELNFRLKVAQQQGWAGTLVNG
jgi:Phage tail lysozyme